MHDAVPHVCTVDRFTRHGSAAPTTVQSARDPMRHARRDEPEAFGEIILAGPSHFACRETANQPSDGVQSASRRPAAWGPCAKPLAARPLPTADGLVAARDSSSPRASIFVPRASCCSFHPKPVAASHPLRSLSSCDRAWPTSPRPPQKKTPIFNPHRCPVRPIQLPRMES
jgi:hypothetical protein